MILALIYFIYSFVVPLSVENFWNRLWLMKAERGTLAPYFFICFFVSCGHWKVKLESLASILPRPYTADTSSYVEPRETAKPRFLGLSHVRWLHMIPVGPSSQPTICRPPSVDSSVSSRFSMMPESVCEMTRVLEVVSRYETSTFTFLFSSPGMGLILVMKRIKSQASML